eukprot:scaffold10567_cov91-Skeletonema_marinoi.AAC.2
MNPPDPIQPWQCHTYLLSITSLSQNNQPNYTMMDLQLMKRLSRTSSLRQAGVALLVTIVGLTSINGPTTPPAIIGGPVIS